MIRKLRLGSKLLTSQTVRQIIIIHKLLNISRSKDSQTMKLGQIVEFNVRIFFFKNHTENEAGRLFRDLFLFFKEVLFKVKASVQHLRFNIFW